MNSQRNQQHTEPMEDTVHSVTGIESVPPQSLRRRRWLYILSAALLVVLLMGAAFVGGQLLSQRNVSRDYGPGVVYSTRASELPDELPIASGPIQNIEGKVITLEMPVGGHGAVYSDSSGVTKKEGEWKQFQVIVTQDTKIYKGVPLSPEEMQEGGEFQSRVEEATLADLKVGAQIEVWGLERGERITADVIHIIMMFGHP